MTERECYTTKSIELHLFFGQILLRQISALSSTPEYNILSDFEEKYKTFLSKTSKVGDCLFHPPISLEHSQEIKYINQDVLLLLQKLKSSVYQSSLLTFPLSLQFLNLIYSAKR